MKNGPDDEKTLWQALAQLAVGITHVQRATSRARSRCSAAHPQALRRTDNPARYAIDVTGLVDYTEQLTD